MAEPYIRQIKSIDEAIKRLNSQLKDLRKQKAISQTRLYEYMRRNNMEETGGVKLKKITPKPKMMRKKEKEKKEDAVHYFESLGLNDPEGTWDRLRELNKPKPFSNEEKKKEDSSEGEE